MSSFAMLQPEPYCLCVLYSKSFLGSPLQCFVLAYYKPVLLAHVLYSTVSKLAIS